MVSTVIAAVLTLSLCGTPASQPPLPGPCGVEIPRALRVLDCRLAASIARDLPHSATLRALVARIEELHGLVYVTTAMEIRRRNNHRLLGATSSAITVAGPCRLVRVEVERRYDESGTAVVAHELHHVSELLQSPNADPGREISSGIRETNEAQDVERRVARELRAGRRHQARGEGW